MNEKALDRLKRRFIGYSLWKMYSGDMWPSWHRNLFFSILEKHDWSVLANKEVDLLNTS